MRGYAERDIFSAHEMELLKRATELVARAPYDIGGEPIRCHELARVVGERLGLTVQDGNYGFVEHTWLWTSPVTPDCLPRRMPNILDVYVPGSLPQVQLHHLWTGSPPMYRWEGPREDIREFVLSTLRKALR